MTELSKIVLGTGNYQNVKSGNTVSITGDGGNAWGYFGPSYKKLAPKLATYNEYASKLSELVGLKKDVLKIKEYLELKRQIEDEYIKSYYDTRLKNLDIKELFYILKEKFGTDIILLCHEPVGEFCHRRLVADYIELETGIYIPEISVSNDEKVTEVLPRKYHSRLIKVINEF